MSGSSQRLDLELVRRGLARSRARAQVLIAEGRVLIDGAAVTKATRKVTEDTDIQLQGSETEDWVGRGALKLIKALDHFGINPKNKICADIGASTGGFSQVLLKRGATRIYAVDVGQGQMVAEIAEDPRLVNLEGVNARDLTPELIPDPLDLIVSDVSFISLTKALPATLKLARPGAHLAALIKPQFEVGKGNVGKGGIVRDEALREMAVKNVTDWINGLAGWCVLGVTESPITGSDGNHEFLTGARYDG